MMLKVDRAVLLARRSSGAGGLLDVKQAAEAAFILASPTEVVDPPFECGLKTADLPVQKFSKKVKKKLASFREVQ